MKCKTHQGPTLERICDVQCTEVPHCDEMPLVANGEPNYLATPFQSYSFSERSWQREIRDLKSSIPKFHIPFAAALQVFNFSYREIGDLQILACTFNSRSHLHGACRIVLPTDKADNTSITAQPCFQKEIADFGGTNSHWILIDPSTFEHCSRLSLCPRCYTTLYHSLNGWVGSL